MIWLEGALSRAATTGEQRKDLLVRVVSLMGLAIFAESVKGSAIEGVNHTTKSISQFSVNGRSGLDSIGPYQSGGGGCCYITPSLWQPGMEVRVNWQTSPGAGSDLSREFPGFADEAKYDEWLDKLEAQERKHTKTVPIPDYTNQKTCGITVHFLPCDELQITTSCYAYGNPNYPIKTPLKLPEPQSCPR